MKIKKTYIEYRENPVGIGTKKPRFFWLLEEEGRGKYQTAYRIQVSESEDFHGLVYDTGKVESEKSVQVNYAGPALNSCTRYYYRVKIWDQSGCESSWSDTAYWENAILDSVQWRADWITPDYDFQAPKTACPIIRKSFHIEKEVVSARIYVTAKGLYELYLNGKKVGNDYLRPGWTSYNKRILYQTYDVTDSLKIGANGIGVVIGSGWYKGELGWRARRNLYGGREAFILELHVIYNDGTEWTMQSDGTWKSSYRGPVTYAEIYHGENYDARLETRFSDADFDDGDWFGVRVMGAVTKKTLIAQESESVTVKHIIKPVALITTPKGERVLDMGQNFAGWVRFRVKGKAGDRVVLRHAEALDSEGNFYTDNLKGAKQRVEYILKGGEEETFRPHFTFQGFRYVKIVEFPGEPSADQFEGLVLYSDLERTGEFVCSDPLVNRLYENGIWSQRSNFIDIPSDCPQRCERLGWTGDIQVYSATASYNMRTPLFLTKWLHDVAAEQFESGGVPWVVPDIYDDTYAYDLSGYVGQSEKVAAGWGDAATICPWMLYKFYGDVRILEEQYDSMKGYVNYIYNQGKNPYLWDTGHQLGDWVALDAPYGSFVGATDTAYCATAYYARSCEILYKSAELLGKTDDLKYYSRVHEKILENFRGKYVLEDGSLSVKTQTAIVLALEFGLVEERYRRKLADELAQMLKDTDYELITGFLGTPYICRVLADNGHSEAAYGLLMRKEYPSWLYQVTKGATTIWEHLDGLKPDGTMWNPRMNSFNHYAYGSVAEWLYGGVCGISPTEDGAGFKHFTFAPRVSDKLSYAYMKLETMYGTVSGGWRRNAEGGYEYELCVPVNTTASVSLEDAGMITESGLSLNETPGVMEVQEKDGVTVFTVSSGRYVFCK